MYVQNQDQRLFVRRDICVQDKPPPIPHPGIGLHSPRGQARRLSCCRAGLPPAPPAWPAPCGEDVDDGGRHSVSVLVHNDCYDDGDDVKDGEILGEYCENLNSGPLAGDREPADEI